MPDPAPRVALLGFSIECNKFAPVATKAHFLARTYVEGKALVAEARSPHPTMLPETPGFVAAMDRSGPWVPVGIALAMTEPNGPVEHGFFVELLETIRRRLVAAMPVDAVYVCAHGAAVTTEEDDPEGELLAMVRGIVGPDVPIAATFDLHANVSERMVQSIDAFIGYRTNPHLDMRERGEEAAAAIREMLAGTRTERALIRLPIVAPTVTLLTAAGPYAEMIEFGQTRIGPEIMNVSVMGGFAYADTAKNGLAVVVTARRGRRNDHAAAAVAREIAEFGWARRERFIPRLTPLADAVAQAPAAAPAAIRCTCCARFTRPGSRARSSASSTIRRSPPRRMPRGSAPGSRRASTATRPASSPSNGRRRPRWRRCTTAIASAGAASMPGCGSPSARARRSASAASRLSSCRTAPSAPTRCSSR